MGSLLKGQCMTEEEIELVAEELAKIGGVSWYPGREPGPLVRVVSDRYRERAKAAIAALDRFRAGLSPQAAQGGVLEDSSSEPSHPQNTVDSESLKPGATIVYRPKGDPRAYVCTVDEIEEGRVRLTPQSVRGIGWVPIENIHPPTETEQPDDQTEKA